MSVVLLSNDHRFPAPHEAGADGLLAVGGDLEPERLLLAYSMGIFPWYEDGLPILWHSPDPRMALRPKDLRVSRSLRKTLRQGHFDVRYDTAFEEVIRACAAVRRTQGQGTWITSEMIDAYVRLHELGFAHSAEAYLAGELVGGLYGVSLGGCFFGESMFCVRSDASKVAFVSLVEDLDARGFDLLDCQVHTEHLERFGGELWERSRFLAALETSLQAETRRGTWRRQPCRIGR